MRRKEPERNAQLYNTPQRCKKIPESHVGLKNPANLTFHPIVIFDLVFDDT